MQIEKHEHYTAWAPIWKRCRDVVSGQDAIHAGEEVYLPRLGGQDDAQYAAYKQRARFLNASDRTVNGMLGLALRKPIQVEPDGQAFEEDVNHSDMSLTEYVAHTLEEVLAIGRAGTLIDYPGTEPGTTTAEAEAANHTPLWAFYAVENIYNWKFEYVNNKYQVTYIMLFDGASVNDAGVDVYNYRELILEDGVYIQRLREATSFDGDALQVGEDILPTMGGNFMPFIPFIFHTAGAREDVVDKPPLLDLFDTNIKHYQLKADHAHALHYIALPTPWITGCDPDDAPSSIGPQRIWTIPDAGAQVGMLEFSGAGVAAIKAELDGIEMNMAQLGSRMLAPDTTTTNETATATAIKSMSENSVLSSIVQATGKQATRLWNWSLEWLGTAADGSVILNTDFLPGYLSGADLTALMGSWQAGGISKETLFINLQQGEIIPADTTFEEEEAKIDEEMLNSQNEALLTAEDMDIDDGDE